MPINPACYPTLAAARGLIALYLLDEATAAPGDTVADSAGDPGGPYNGIVTHSVIIGGSITPQEAPLAECAPGTCFNFNRDWVTVAHPGITALNTAPACTLFAWIRRYDGSGSTGLDFSVCERGFGAMNGGIALLVNGNVGDPDNDALTLAVYDPVNLSPDFLYAPAPAGHVVPGQIAFVAATFDRSTLEANLYVDGQPVANATLTQDYPSATADMRFWLATDSFQPAQSRGHIDNLGVCAVALTDDEILALYNACQCARPQSWARWV